MHVLFGSMVAWIGIKTVTPAPYTLAETVWYTIQNDLALAIFLGIIICMIMYASFCAGNYIAYKVVKTINGS